MPKLAVLVELAIHNNDYEKLKKLLDDNPDFISCYHTLAKALNMRFKKCFDLIVDKIDFDDNDDLEYYYKKAINIYLKGKNEENKYFILKMLEKKLNVSPYYIIPDIIEVDINIFHKYIDIIKKENNIRTIKLLLHYLLDNKGFIYFHDIFNMLNDKEQINFVKQYLYLHEYDYFTSYKNQQKKSSAISYFLNNKNFDYNKMMKKYMHEHIIIHLLNYGFMSNECINYLLNNPVDFKFIKKDIESYYAVYPYGQAPLIYKPFKHDCYIKLIKFWKKNKLINKPLIINCPKISLLSIIIEKNQYSNINNNLLLFCYILNKLGINFNVYNEITIEYFNEHINSDTLLGDLHKNNFIINLINVVQFGNYMKQPIPEHLKGSIYNFCNNDEKLNKVYTEKELKQMMKKMK